MILISLLAALTAVAHPQANAWRGIVPLHSTRADVEKILGPPTPDSKARDAADYRTEHERVFVLYSTGSCRIKPSNGWNVPRGTVIEISVEPNVKPKFADLKLDGSNYEKTRDPEVLNFTYYTNKEEGVSITVNTEQGVVTAFSYSPMSKDDHLRCITPTRSAPQITGFTPHKIAEYSDIPFSAERQHLDDFAKQLLSHPADQGYIFAYAGRRACPNEALKLATRAKNYMVKKRNVAATHLVIVVSGYKERWSIELYIVPPGVTVPPATPTIDPSQVQIIRNCNMKK